MDAYRNKNFTVLEKLIDEGSNYDLDLTAIAEKIKSYINSQQKWDHKNCFVRFFLRRKDNSNCWTTRKS